AQIARTSGWWRNTWAAAPATSSPSTTSPAWGTAARSTMPRSAPSSMCWRRGSTGTRAAAAPGLCRPTASSGGWAATRASDLLLCQRRGLLELQRGAEELPHVLHRLLLCVFVVRNGRALLDAGVVIVERPLGLRIDYLAERLLLEDAVARSRSVGKLERRLSWPVERVSGIGILEELHVPARAAEAADVGATRPDRHVVVGRAVKDANGRVIEVGVLDVRSVAGRIEGQVGGEPGACGSPHLLKPPHARVERGRSAAG